METQTWEKELTDRERKELEFARTYTEMYNHGTDGHNRLNLIAKLANLLDIAHANGEKP